MIQLIAFIIPVPGKESILREKLQSLVPITHQEKGCVMYALHETTDTPKRFVFVEKWETQDDLNNHLQSAHIRAALALKGELFTDLQIIPLNSLSSQFLPKGIF